ncbi:hypothetical protein B0J14DRAFT_240447 [Halenospora varia]|nr:hypothetical protein B0J14DRAFT_240447 [Halenospora varia]
MKSQNKQSRGLLGGFIALALALGILFLVVFVIFYVIYLPETGPLSSVKRSLYITGTTIGATFSTAWISTSVQGLLAKRLNCELEN